MVSLSRRRLLVTAALASLSRVQAATLSEIRLGVTTDEIDEDLLTAARFLRRFGLSYGEVRSIWGKYNTSQPIEKVREARAILDEYQIHTSILGTGFFKVPLPAETPEGKASLDEQWALLDGAMERAALLGTDKLRVFAFMYKSGEQPDPKNYPRIYELLREAARRAKAKKMRLAVENVVGGSYVATGAESSRMLKAVPDENFGLTWDPNNAGMSGEKAFPEGFEKLDPARIFHVHLRDYRHLPDGKVEWCAVGEGEFDNLGQLRALLKTGYRGTFTLETHYRSPKGKAYASETSLKALLKVIEQV